MARQEGIEPPTHSLEGCCSIQLSYWRFIRDRPAPLASSCQVGAPGFEPGTSCSQSRRDTRLRYAPHESPTLVGRSARVNHRTTRILRVAPTHRKQSSLPQYGEERVERPASMAHRALLLRGRIGQRHSELVRQEVGVVAESMEAG